MAQTDTRKKDTAPVDHGDIAGGAVVTAQGAARMRLPYPKSLEQFAGISPREWQVLIDATFPSAKTVEAICMAVAYCKERKLDIFKKTVHIVPVWSKAENREIETVWPSIAEVRITASRTGSYAGKDATAFGPDTTKKFSHTKDNKTEELEITFPEWAQVTVYRLVQGVRCAFVGPKVFWLETYATRSKWSEIPNDMWADRRSQQLEKCAEAAALRMAFPEELSGEYTSEEMYGKSVDLSGVKTFGAASAPAAASDEIVTPPRPEKSDFERDTTQDTGEKKPAAEKPATAEKAQPEKPAAAAAKAEPEGDPRGSAPPHDGEAAVEEVEGEVVSDGEQQDGEEAPAQVQAEPAARSAFDDWFDDQVKELDKYDTIRSLAAFYDSVMKEIEGDDDRMRDFTKAYEARQEAIKAAKKKPGK